MVQVSVRLSLVFLFALPAIKLCSSRDEGAKEEVTLEGLKEEVEGAKEEIRGSKVQKLQIGVKKRVEDCTVRSQNGDVLHVHYTGTLEDGTQFDSSRERDPFIFKLGTGQVIKGWEQGMLKMCEGELRKLVIPSDLGYGTHGSPPVIPGNAVLHFDIELLKIERREEL